MRKSSRQTSYLNLELTQGLSARSNSIHHAFITLTSNQIDKWVCIYVMDNGLCYLHKTANWGSIRYGSKKFKCHFGWFLLSPHSHKKKILRVWGSWWNQINYQKGIIYQIVFLFCQYIQEDRSVKSDCLLYPPVWQADLSTSIQTDFSENTINAHLKLLDLLKRISIMACQCEKPTPWGTLNTSQKQWIVVADATFVST